MTILPKTPVMLETPYRGKDDTDRSLNESYARICALDCMLRGEAPFGSHIMYAMSKVLNEDSPEQRKLGIECGFVWRHLAVKTVVYTDIGLTKGMHEAINHARDHNLPVEYRTYPNFKEKFGEIA